MCCESSLRDVVDPEQAAMNDEFQRECNVILDNDEIFEEDKVDMLEELVSQRFKCSAKECEKIILDIMWKHKDPSSRKQSKPQVVNVEMIESKIDIPSFERRIELEKQMVELQSLLEDHKISPVRSKQDIDREYNELLEKTQNLRKELYGSRPATSNKSSPIDHLYNMFDGNVSRLRIEKLLKLYGYDVIETASVLVQQLKAAQHEDEPKQQQPFFSQDKKNKTLCSFFAKTGKCLRSDCKFSHDLDKRAVCSFWLKGSCLAGENCLFKHSLDDLSQLGEATGGAGLVPAAGAGPGGFSGSGGSAGSAGSAGAPGTAVAAASTGPRPVSITRPLKKPQLVPWDEKATHPELKKYTENRILANKSEAQRRKFAKLSTEAWKANNAGKAKQLSDKANKFEDDYFDYLKKSDDYLYEFSLKLSDEFWFEMNGLEFNDAVDQLLQNINEVKKSSPKKSKTIYIIVPSTLTPHEYKKTTKPITIWLDHEGYRWQQLAATNVSFGSIIAIDPWIG